MAISLNDNALTTIAAIEEALSLSAGSADDFITRLINTGSDLIENYCNREFQYVAVSDEEHIGTGNKILVLDRTPIVSITEISYDDTALSSDEYEIYDSDAGLVYHVTGVWEWTAPSLNNIAGDPFPGQERKLYKASYGGGYVLPNDDGTRTLPYDLEQACIDFCVWKYRTQGDNPAIKSESLSKYSVEYRDIDESGIPFFVCSVLARYKRFS